KSFAKRMMSEAGVPTARAIVTTGIEEAKRAVAEFGAPVVIKASGLAAGKGVVVARTIAEAEAAIDHLLGKQSLGDAGSEILVEEFMEGVELSLFVLTDGTTAIPMMPAQDHKRLLDGDAGPNTGGMGAYAPVSLGTAALVQKVMDSIIQPSLAWMRENDAPFTGLLYAGLMVTRDGPKVVEFNCRFGDPETQALLPLLDSSLVEPMQTIASGESLTGLKLEWSRSCAVATVVAAAGYPDAPQAGDLLTIPDVPANVHVFHAGTARDSAGRLVSAGGRVLTVTAVTGDICEGARLSRETAERVGLKGKQMRQDIGWRELAGRVIHEKNKYQAPSGE
ncbi:MAG: phosphoribosylamine--glycine ligase, partial [Gemmatimonadaceae bacterium]